MHTERRDETGERSPMTWAPLVRMVVGAEDGSSGKRSVLRR